MEKNEWLTVTESNDHVKTNGHSGCETTFFLALKFVICYGREIFKFKI